MESSKDTISLKTPPSTCCTQWYPCIQVWLAARCPRRTGCPWKGVWGGCTTTQANPSPKYGSDLGMHLRTSEDPLTGSAGILIKGLLPLLLNKFCNYLMLLLDSICVLFVFEPLQYRAEMWVMRYSYLFLIFFFDMLEERKGRQLYTLCLMLRSPLFAVWESYNAILIPEVILLKGSEVKVLASITR